MQTERQLIWYLTPPCFWYLLVRCKMFSILFRFVQSSFSVTLDWSLRLCFRARTSVWDIWVKECCSENSWQSFLSKSEKLLLVNTIYVWPGGLECAHHHLSLESLGVTQTQNKARLKLFGAWQHTRVRSATSQEEHGKGCFEGRFEGNTHSYITVLRWNCWRDLE